MDRIRTMTNLMRPNGPGPGRARRRIPLRVATLGLVAGLLALPAYGGAGAVAASAGRPVRAEVVQAPVTGMISVLGGWF